MRKQRLLTIILSLLAVMIFANGCGNASAGEVEAVECDGNVAANIASTESELADAEADFKDAEGTPTAIEVESRIKRLDGILEDLRACPQEPEAAAPVQDGDAGVEDSDGELRSLPLVDDLGDVVKGDTTADPRTPATYADARAHGALVNWQQLIDTMGDKQWYIDGINARKSKTGFGWDDVVRWAAQSDVETRVIHVYNLDYTDEQARDAVRELIGDDADKLNVARHSCVVNTRGFGRDTMQDFVDCRKMVRVSLSPIVYDKNDVAVGLRSDTGVFVDCFNLWWIPRQVVKQGPPPPPATVPPGTTPPATVPPGTVPPATVPPGTTPPATTPPTVLTPKDPKQDVNVNPHVPPQVKGPGTTPIGVDPGPAVKPVDTPTGCSGSCVGTVVTPPPVTAPSTGPGSSSGAPGSGSSGNGTPLPSGGNQGVTNPQPAGIPSTTSPPVGDPGGW